MRPTILYSAAALFFVSLSLQSNAGTIPITFTGPGVSGTLELSYGSGTDSKYPQALEATGAGGTFTDTNIGIVGATITGLEPINYATPEPTNLLAPHDFSKFAVVSGLPPQSHGVITYDNLYYPGGSPQTASDYPLHGGLADIYGVLFDIGGGRVVDFWSNGYLPGTSSVDYGIAVATSEASLDYTGGVTATTPEPGTLGLLGTGLLGMVFRGRRSFGSFRRARS